MRGRMIYRGWWAAAAVFMSSAVCIGAGIYGFGIFIEPLESTFGWSRAQISASLSFAMAGSLIGPFLGRIMDRHGVRPVMAASLLTIGGGFALRPLMTELWHWYALSFMQYAGFAGAASPLTSKLIGAWFHRTRGRAIGVTAMGNNFGGLVMPPMLGALLPLVSWKGAYAVLGAMTAGIAVFTLFAVRDFPTRAELGDEVAAVPAEGPLAPSGVTLQQALRSGRLYAIMAAVLFGTFTYSAILPHIVTQQTDSGTPLHLAALLLSVFAIFGMIGKFVMGYVAERITSRWALTITFVGMSAFLVAMIWAGNPWVAWTAVPLFGFFSGAFGSLFQLVVLDGFGVRNFGGIMGVINMTTVVSFGAGPLLTGISYDVTGGYTFVFATVAAMFAAAAAAMAAAGGGK